MTDAIEIVGETIWFRSWQIGLKPPSMPVTQWDELLGLLIEQPTEAEREKELSDEYDRGLEDGRAEGDGEKERLQDAHAEALDSLEAEIAAQKELVEAAYAEGYQLRLQEALDRRKRK